MPTDGNPMLTKNLPKVTAADLAVSDGLMGDTAERGTVLITLEEAMKFLDMKRGYHSNPNLLDVWYFADPINQRGQTEYTTVDPISYFIDRWQHQQNITIILADNGLIMRPNSATITRTALVQLVEKSRLIADADFTLSVLTADNELLVLTFKYNHSTAFRFTKHFSSLPTSYIDIQTTVSSDTITVGIVNKSGLNNADLVLVAAKLELGPVQTLAHKEGDIWILNDPPPNKALELAKCQRYQIELAKLNTNSCVGIGVAQTATECWVFIPTPQTLRTKPIATFNGNWVLKATKNSSQSEPITSFVVQSFSANGVSGLAKIADDASQKLVVGNTYELWHSEASANFLLDSNL